MTASASTRSFPLGAIIGAGALVGLAVVSATLSRTTGIGATRLAPSTAVESRSLNFEDRADGAVVVRDATNGHEIAVFAPGTNGFARGALRGLARERHRNDVGAQPPFLLTRWADGRLSLADPATGRKINLEVFGPTNAAAFVRILSTPGKSS